MPAGSLLETTTEAAKGAPFETRICFHPLVRASISFETTNKAVNFFVAW